MRIQFSHTATSVRAVLATCAGATLAFSHEGEDNYSAIS